VARGINQNLYDYFKDDLHTTRRCLLFAGLLMSFQSKDILDGDNRSVCFDYEDKRTFKGIIEKLKSCIQEVMYKKINNIDKTFSWNSEFSFLDNIGNRYDNTKKGNYIEYEKDNYDIDLKINKNEDQLLQFKKIINKVENLYKKIKRDVIGYDYIGICFTEFLRKFEKGENQKGIILTPEHIKKLFIKLSKINENDTILDTCTGSGGFLIEAFNELKRLVNNDEKKVSEIAKNQLIGIEKDATMFALVCCNMTLHNDGSSNLMFCKMQDERINKIKADICFINPPYEKIDGLNSSKFVLRALNLISKQLIVIMPSQELNTTDKETKRKIFEIATLETVIKMPNNLFKEGNVNPQTSIFIFNKGKQDLDKEVYYYNLEDDGYEVIPHNGRIPKNNGDNWKEIEKDLIYNVKNKRKINEVAYSKKLKIDENGAIIDDCMYEDKKEKVLYVEDFEEAIFDYWLFENSDGGGGKSIADKLKEISNRDIKKFIIRELKNGKS
jgi:type I restriction-modification system DNA methylase subunit